MHAYLEFQACRLVLAGDAGCLQLGVWRRVAALGVALGVHAAQYSLPRVLGPATLLPQSHRPRLKHGSSAVAIHLACLIGAARRLVFLDGGKEVCRKECYAPWLAYLVLLEAAYRLPDQMLHERSRRDPLSHRLLLLLGPKGSI